MPGQDFSVGEKPVSFLPFHLCHCICSVLARSSHQLWREKAWATLAVNISTAFTDHHILGLTFFVLTDLDLVSVIRVCFPYFKIA